MLTEKCSYTLHLLWPTIPDKRNHLIECIIRECIKLDTISRNKPQPCLPLIFKDRRQSYSIYQAMEKRRRIEVSRNLTPYFFPCFTRIIFKITRTFIYIRWNGFYNFHYLIIMFDIYKSTNIRLKFYSILNYYICLHHNTLLVYQYHKAISNFSQTILDYCSTILSYLKILLFPHHTDNQQSLLVHHLL